jgi:hypothetical protein
VSNAFQVNGTLPDIILNRDNVYEGDLRHYLKILWDFAQNLNHPYHNFRHMTHVLFLCHDACVYYGRKLTRREKRNLLIAALFHDFDHSGMFGHDDLNITRAVRGLRKHILSEDLVELGNIEYLILVTKYPHTEPVSRFTLSGQIMCDADLSQALNPAWIQQVVFGLASEWGNTPTEVFSAQEDFILNSLRFATEWAHARFPQEVIAKKLEEVRLFMDILGIESRKAA